MLGRSLEPGVIYADNGDWLLVKTRGPLITRGVDEPIVRMTVADRQGSVRRVYVYARRRYQTMPASPGAHGGSHRAPVPRAGSAIAVPRPAVHRGEPVRVAQSLSQSQPKLVLAECGHGRATAAKKPKARAPQLKIEATPSPYLEEACYWLPREARVLRPSEYAIVESLSALPWADSTAVRRSSEGALVEHDVPAGVDIVELARRVHRTEQPSRRQVEALGKALEPLLIRGIVEQVPEDRRRFRLRGWQCLHTRRRTTRRAIEHGGGRAVYVTVGFSA